MVATLPFIGFYLGVHYQKLLERSKYTPPQEQRRICKGDKCITAKAVRHPLEQAKGLMFQEHLNKDEGMLFIFKQESIIPFWMKNTIIPLDIIWMNSKREIVYIHKKAEPCLAMMCPSINPGKRAQYVLEINTGIVDEMKLEVGDVLTITY